MQELEFRYWLSEKNISKKVQYDIISRIKKFEKEMDYLDIDMEYAKDKCVNLLATFKNKGKNEAMKNYKPINLPVNTNNLRIYKYAINKYLQFLNTHM